MFFQNPFEQEFRGNIVLGDRQYSLTFVIKPNRNKSDYQLAYNNGPWDFTPGPNPSILTINYSWDQNFKNWSALSIDVAGAVPSATTAQEVVAKLMGNPTFAELFSAQLFAPKASLPTVYTVFIVPNPKRQVKTIRVYISNTGAERALRFNKYAGVAELPSYMERHTVANRFIFPDSAGMLIKLDQTDTVTDQPIIQDAGLDPSAMLADWQLFGGRSQLFNFQKLTVDGADRITQTVEYPAGSKAGDLGRKINYTYTGTNTNPSQVTEIPYTLQSGDLITPP